MQNQKLGYLHKDGNRKLIRNNRNHQADQEFKWKSIIEEIFLQDHVQNDKQCEEILYQKASDDNENDYLSQFLNSQGSQNLSVQKSPQSQHLRSTENQIVQQRSVFSVEGKQNTGKIKKREKSCFHNFQKHLVITLRNMIKLKKCTKSGEIQTIGYEMWTVFAKSTLYSKKYLHVLFGVFGNNEQNQFSKNFLNDLGFMQVFAKYSEDKIKQAQRYLRRQIIRQLQHIDMKEYLTFRKLKRVQEFQTYLQEFIGELKEGSIRKRLPKNRKLVMTMLQHQQNRMPQHESNL